MKRNSSSHHPSGSAVPVASAWGRSRTNSSAVGVSGTAWRLRATSAGPGKVVVCFTPTHYGLVLSLVAARWGFTPLDGDKVPQPDGLCLTWLGQHFALLTAGRPLWTGVADSEVQAPATGTESLVLVLDQPAAGGFPRVLPSQIWGANVPVVARSGT